MNSRQRYCVPFVLCCGLAAISGCGTTAAVPDSERDTTGSFDGVWQVKVLDARTKQQPIYNWRLNCENMAWEFPVTVANGIMRANIDAAEHVTNVNGDGEFQLVIKTAHNVEAKAGSSATLHQGAVTLYVSGDLDGESPAGNYRAGIKEFGDNGCRTKASFARR